MNSMGTLLIISVLLVILILSILSTSLIVIDKKLINLFNEKDFNLIKYLDSDLNTGLKKGVACVNYGNISLEFFIFLEAGRLIKIIK